MLVSFAIVAYNEERYLPRLLGDLRLQTYPHGQIELLLIDSRSTDATRSLMEAFAAQEHDFYRVCVLDNPGVTIPCGHNVALDNYRGDALIRVDAHASVPPDFIEQNVRALEGGEMICGGQRPNIIDEPTPWREALLTAEQSMMGSSFAPYRRSKKKMYTRSVFCGMYRREVYDKVGRYNELLPRSEDNDMTWRVREAGFRLLYSPDIIFYQYTRSTLRSLLRQKFLNGYWIGKTMGVNPHCFAFFHFVPLLFVLGIVLTGVLAFLGHPLPGLLMWGAYLLLTVIATVVEMVKKPSWAKLLLPALFLMLHVCYGAGTLAGLIAMPFWIRRVRRREKK